jgi:hypothetical protein
MALDHLFGGFKAPGTGYSLEVLTVHVPGARRAWVSVVASCLSDIKWTRYPRTPALASLA